jgi:CRP-like cAMP-binding protein
MEALRSVICDKVGLKDHHFDTFIRVAKKRSLSKKKNLITAGLVCNFLGIVNSGTLRSYIIKADEEFNNDFYYDNSFISAYTSFLTQQPTNCNIQAITDAEVYLITFRQLEELVSEDLEWLRLSKYVSDLFFIRKCKRETSFLLNSAAERLNVIKTLYPDIEQKVPQYHIASYLGIKPESLSRIKLLTYINK